MTQTFKPYSEIPVILEQAEKKNQHIATTLREYILQFSNDFSQLKDKLTKLTNDPLVMEKKNEKKDEEIFHSELFKAFPGIAVNHLLQIPSYRAAAEELKKFADRGIIAVSNEYTERNKSLREKFMEALASFEAVKQENDHAMFDMKDAEILLYNAEKEGKTDLEDLKKAFVDARNNAIHVHKKCSDETDTLSVKMENLLTQFEELEVWHAEKMKEILTDFAQTLMQIANNFVFGSSEMNEAVSEIPIELDSHVIAKFDQFRPAETDDFFQVWAVNPLASKFLSKELMYKEELERGCQLFVVKEDYKGTAGHLNGLEGEIVCGLEQKGDCVLCKNINDSVGLLPQKILGFPK